MKKNAIVLVCLFFILSPGCDDEVICTQDVISRVYAGFYVRDMAGKRDTALSSLTFYAVMRPDSLLYDSTNGIHMMFFPLPSQTDAFTSFVFRTDSLTDTIHIYHSPTQELVSYSCGFTTIHRIETLTYGSNAIDTIAISNPLVSFSDNENLEIYVWPAVVADTVK